MTRSAFFRLLTASAFVFAALTSGRADAASALIINNPAGSEPTLAVDIANNVSSKLTAKGLTTTITNTVPGALAPYQQIWDLRFQTSSPITVGERGQYVNYLNGGGGMFVMGENAGFAARNTSVLSLIQDAGGGTLTFITSASTQTVLAAAQSPNPITTITYRAPGGVTGPGTGQCLTRDGSGNCAAVAWGAGTLANASTGTLTVVFDVNFMETIPSGGGVNEAAFFNNLVNFVSVQAGGGSNFAALGATEYQQAVGGAFNRLFGNTSGELSSIMVNIAGMGSRADQQRALEASANSFPQVAFSNAFRGIQANLMDINRWVSSNPFTPAPVQTAAADPMKVAMAFGNDTVMTDAPDMNLARLASAVSPMSTWSNGHGMSAFLNLGYIGGDHDATTNQAAFNYNGIAGTGGVAYALTKEFTVGGGVGIDNITSHIGDSRGNSTTGTYNLIGFGHFADGTGLYADATANAGYVDYGYDRNIAVGAFSTKAHGETNGWQLGASMGGGYDFNIDNGGKTGIMKNVVVGPFAQLQYQFAHLAGFTESGAGTASLNVSDQGVHSLTLKVGGRMAGEVESPLGPFVPMLSVAYEREFLNGSRSVGTSFVGGPTVAFGTPVDEAEKNFAVVGLGVTKDVGDGFTAGLSYGGRFNLKDKQHTVTLRGKLDF